MIINEQKSQIGEFGPKGLFGERVGRGGYVTLTTLNMNRKVRNLALMDLVDHLILS